MRSGLRAAEQQTGGVSSKRPRSKLQRHVDDDEVVGGGGHTPNGRAHARPLVALVSLGMNVSTEEKVQDNIPCNDHK